MRKDYEQFINGVQKSLDKKNYSEDKKQRILDKIKKKYENFFEFDVVEEHEDDLLICTDNCFGIDNDGFDEINEVPRIERVSALRQCYSSSEPVFEEQYVISNPLNERGRFGRAAIHDAVAEGDLNKVDQMLSQGADPFITDNNGHTPYMMAKMNGDNNMLKHLKKSGIKE